MCEFTKVLKASALQKLSGEKITLGSQKKEGFFLEEVVFELYLNMTICREILREREHCRDEWFTQDPKASKHKSEKNVNNSD